MLKRLCHVIVLFASVFCSTVVMGQEEATLQRYYPTIETAEIVPNADNSYRLVVAGFQATGCETPTIVQTERVGLAWYVDIYQELPADVICPMILLSLNEQIDAAPLFELDAEATLPDFVVLNGTIYGVSRAQIEPIGSPVAPAPILSTLWAKSALSYERIITQHMMDGTMQVTLEGTLTDGCATPIIRAVSNGQGHVSVQAYSVVPLDAMCAQVMTPFAVTVATPLFDTLSVNDTVVPFDLAISSDTQRFVEQALPITKASAMRVDGVTIEISITTILDGCEDPVQIVPQAQADNSFLVKVVRVVRDMTVCTQIAREVTATMRFIPVLTGETDIVLYIGQDIITLPIR